MKLIGDIGRFSKQQIRTDTTGNAQITITERRLRRAHKSAAKEATNYCKFKVAKSSRSELLHHMIQYANQKLMTSLNSM